MLDEICDCLTAIKEICEIRMEVGENDDLRDLLATAAIRRTSRLIAAIETGEIREAGDQGAPSES